MSANGATVTAVTSAATATTLAAANVGRRGDATGPSLNIANDSTAVLYILIDADTNGTVSSTNYSYSLAGKGSGVAPSVEIWGFKGKVTGIWASANGFAYVTEFK